MEYLVRLKDEETEDDNLRVEIPLDVDDFWRNLQSGTCPDCGGTWVWWEAGYVPGTRKCVGRPVGFCHNPTAPDPIPQFDIDGGCGSFFTVLGEQYDEDDGADAKARSVGVLRRERFYYG